MTKIYCSNKNCKYYKQNKSYTNKGTCTSKELFMRTGDDEMGQVTGYDIYCPYSKVEYIGEQ